MGWGDGTLNQTINAKLEAEAKHKAEVETRRKAAAELKSKTDAASAQFCEEYGVLPAQYIRLAVLAVHSGASEKGGYQGRSRSGASHSANPYYDPKDKFRDPDGNVVKYHKAENDARAHARSGDLEKAVESLNLAEHLRIEEAKVVGSTDAGHAKAMDVIDDRRRSIGNLKNKLNANADPRVVEAKLLVKNFFKQRDIEYLTD